MRAGRVRRGGYAPIAGEYYDPALHPTSHALGEASRELIVPELEGLRGRVLEVGAGRGLVAQVVAAPVEVVTSDVEPEMLSYAGSIPRRVLADATALPFHDESFDLVVAGLGDPYNQAAFWGECHRVLRRDGRVVYTTPSYRWARAFRAEEGAPLNRAVFERGDGVTIAVPSTILEEPQQLELIERSGLVRVTVKHLGSAGIAAYDAAPKLHVSPGELATLYVARRPR